MIRKTDGDYRLAPTLHQSSVKQGKVEYQIQFFVFSYDLSRLIDNPSFAAVVQNKIMGPSLIPYQEAPQLPLILLENVQEMFHLSSRAYHFNSAVALDGVMHRG